MLVSLPACAKPLLQSFAMTIITAQIRQNRSKAPSSSLARAGPAGTAGLPADVYFDLCLLLLRLSLLILFFFHCAHG